MKIFINKGKKNSYENRFDKMYYVRRIESLLMEKNCTIQHIMYIHIEYVVHNFFPNFVCSIDINKKILRKYKKI